MPSGSFLKALSVGAKTVKGPGPLRLPSICAAFSAVTRVVNRPSAWAVSTIFFMPDWLVGATVVAVVVGAAVVTIVVGATVVTFDVGAMVVSMVVGAAVISVVTVGTGVGVTGGLWVAHPENSTLAVIRTAKIRKILFLSMTEFSTSLLVTRNVLTLI